MQTENISEIFSGIFLTRWLFWRQFCIDIYIFEGSVLEIILVMLAFFVDTFD